MLVFVLVIKDLHDLLFFLKKIKRSTHRHEDRYLLTGMISGVVNT